MFQLQVTKQFKKTYPHAGMGILVIKNINNVIKSEALEAEKRLLEENLRVRFTSREAIKENNTLRAYAAYYKRFKKNYHVFFQVESVAVKGKPIPSVNALVEAMFMGELAHMLLTAGHDLDKVKGPVRLDAASGDEMYQMINGKDQQLKQNDMYVADEESVLSSVIYGPDQRTMITTDTKQALFTIYAPNGINRVQIQTQMDTIAAYVRVFSPDAAMDTAIVYPL